MLHLKNCEIREIQQEFIGRKIVIFGIGNYYEILQKTNFEEVAEQVSYVVDNSPKASTISFYDRELQLASPDKLRAEKDCVIILTSPVYMYDMFCQLKEMNLAGKIDCYAFPFMQLVSKKQMEPALLRKVYSNDGDYSIPKIIHCFWFSGEQKPENYQRCIDTWKEKCPEYKIIEWNKDNYNWEKNEFCKHAIEVQAWAFASDYARLDVIYQMGGFYLDMDVEIIKSFDDLIYNKSLFSYSNQITVDLATFASQKENELVKKMLDLYDNIDTPETKRDYMSFFQPRVIQGCLRDYGLFGNGELQIVDGNVFLPRTFFMPMDTIIFEMSALSEYTHSIHYDNFGWNAGHEDIRQKKIKSNRKLWNLVEQ